MYQFIEKLKSDETFFFYQGRVALFALLKAMGIGESDEVIQQVFTCFHVPTPIAYLGARPVYVDIDPRTFNIDPDKIEEKITPKTKAIIVQHTFGIPAEMDQILDIARRHNLWVIEDSCHALGSKYRGQEVGTFGDAAFYSFGWFKPVVLGAGGAAVVNNPDLKRKMKDLYDGFIAPSLRAAVVLLGEQVVYDLLVTPTLFTSLREVYRNPRIKRVVAAVAGSRRGDTSHNGKGEGAGNTQVIGGTAIYNKKLIAFQHARLFKKLGRYDKLVAHQQWVVSQYEGLVAQAGYEPIELDSQFEPIYYKYPLLSDSKKEIFERARQAGIELSDMFISPLYPTWHRKIWESLGYREGMCPISESTSDRIVPLSIHSKIRAKEIERTMALLASFG